jgi:hypothetical protein
MRLDKPLRLSERLRQGFREVGPPLAPISASSASFLVESLAVGNAAFADPSPRPYRSPSMATEIATVLATASAWIAAVRRL